MATVPCPNCGAGLEPPREAAAVVVCEFCNAYSLVHKGELSLAGKQAPLAEIPSILEIGATGKLFGRPFTAMGRVRYDYGDGLWDEWSLFFEDGSMGWLQEDEGELTFFEERIAQPEQTDLSVSVGAQIPVAGHLLFVTEVGDARLVGGQGQITSHLSPGQCFEYVDGTTSGRLAVAMSAPGLTVLFLGRPVEPGDLVR